MNHEPTRRALLLSGLAAGVGALTAPAAEPAGVPLAKPEDLGLDPRRLQVAYDLLEKWTTGPNAAVPSAAIAVGRAGKLVAPRLYGRQGPEADAEPIRRDALFLMASITKPIVYLGAMLLVERGQLNLADRVTRYLPEFAVQGKEETQVVHLFTHTSGLPDELPNNAALRKENAPLKKFMAESIAAAPLFKAGTKLSYSSAATLVVAAIVEKLSGLSIAEYIKREVLTPLGLKNTGLGSQGFSRERLVRAQVPDYQAGTEFSWNSVYWQQLGSPAGGLFTTPEDLAVICAMMLGNGKYGDLRLLSPATVRMMTANRLDDFPDLPEPIRRTQPWGLGWRLNHTSMPDSWGDLLGRHVFGHTGSAGTMVWMDPQTQGFAILFTNALRAKAPWRLVHLSNAIAASFVA